MIQAEEKLLETLDLRTILNVDEGRLTAVDGVNISVNRGETLGIVGESGCGKSMLAQSILRIEPKYAQISGEINLYSKFGDRMNLASYARNSVNLREVRGGRVFLYGSGDIADIFSYHNSTVLSNCFEIVGVMDGNPLKENMLYNDFVITTPEKAKLADEDMILIASQDDASIKSMVNYLTKTLNIKNRILHIVEN